MGYPETLLSSRAIIQHGRFAIIPPEGLVKNVIPHFENCNISIVASPKLGASFVQYIIEMLPKGKTSKEFGDNEEESFVFCQYGEIEVRLGSEIHYLTDGGFAYCPPGQMMNLNNSSGQSAKLLLYKQRHETLEDFEPWVVIENINKVEKRAYDDMDNVTIQDLLPTDLAFDMNMHVLTFEPGGSHPFIETHVQEHGAYLLTGEGVYYLDNRWIPVKKGDYIWFGPYVPQAVYCTGREKLSYIYSKDCNRDVRL